jgi:hypothetical protein
VVASSGEPEALALLGELRVRCCDPARGWRDIVRARQGHESLLASHRLAFADHAAEFYLGPGADAERAWALARENLVARQTRRALDLAIRAALRGRSVSGLHGYSDRETRRPGHGVRPGPRRSRRKSLLSQ